MTRLELIKSHLVKQVLKLSAKDIFTAIGTKEICLYFPLDKDIFDMQVYEKMIDSDEQYSRQKDNVDYDACADFFRIFLKYVHQVVV